MESRCFFCDSGVVSRNVQDDQNRKSSGGLWWWWRFPDWWWQGRGHWNAYPQGSPDRRVVVTHVRVGGVSLLKYLNSLTGSIYIASYNCFLLVLAVFCWGEANLTVAAGQFWIPSYTELVSQWFWWIFLMCRVMILKTCSSLPLRRSTSTNI